jgi:hypothetical protein
MKRLHLSFAALLVVATVLSTAISSVSLQSRGSYDPWVDINDDGTIDIFDIVAVALAFGSSGTPINKTDLLLDLQDRVAALESRMPQGGVVTIAPNAFFPLSPTQTYYRAISILIGSGMFVHQLQVPHGVTLTNLTFTLIDNVTDGQVVVGLEGMTAGIEGFSLYSSNTGIVETPGYVVDHGVPTNATIDNTSTYTLYVGFTYETEDLYLFGVRVEYEYPDP